MIGIYPAHPLGIAPDSPCAGVRHRPFRMRLRQPVILEDRNTCDRVDAPIAEPLHETGHVLDHDLLVGADFLRHTNLCGKGQLAAITLEVQDHSVQLGGFQEVLGYA